MTDLNRAVAELGEYSDDAHNDNGQAVTPGRSVSSIAPTTAVVGVATPVSVTGTGFEDGNDIHVAGATVGATTFVTPSQLRATVTAATPGAVTVTVGGASGSGTLTVTAAGTQGAATGNSGEGS